MTAIVYRGKYPHNIESRWSETWTRNERDTKVYMARTNNGRVYRVHVVAGKLPNVGSDINNWSAFDLVRQSELRH